MDSPSPLMYIAVVVLIAFSAFFSASETIISSFNRLRMKKRAQEGAKSAQAVLRLSDNYDKTLSTILIGNNIVNIAASTIATLIATSWFGLSGPWISTLVMTLLVLTFGEIIPKTYGRQNADSLATKVAGPLSLISTVFTPLSALFLRFNRMTIKDDDDEAPPPTVTEAELMYIIESIEEEGVLEEQERDLVKSALAFDDTTIKEIVTPRVNLVTLDVEASQEEITETILSEGYSRMPVYEGSVDSIIGILVTRDYLRCLVRGETPNLRELIKEPYFVHKSLKLSQLLANLKVRQSNMAVVLDEYGGTLGIVTMEDILEELVGEIWDEDDEIPEAFVPLDDTHFSVLGDYDILDMLTELGYEDEGFDTDHNTVGGWVSHMMGHIPQVGESFDYMDLRLTVVEMDGHRVARILVEKYPEHTDSPPSEDEEES